MEADGSAKSTVAGNDNKTGIFNSFLQHVAASEDEQLSQNFGAKFEEVPDEVLGARDIWARFATYITDVYTSSSGSNKGKKLGVSVSQQLWTGVIHQARGRCSKSSQQVKVRTPYLTARFTVMPRACMRAHFLRVISRDCVG